MAGISAVRKDKNGRDLPMNSIYMMSHSGARGSPTQMRQLAGDARPDGQAVGRDHREPDHLQLQGGPVGSRVLQLDPRRPQGPRRHGAEDRQLRLSDASSRRRRAGLDHHLARLRLDAAASRCGRSSTPARSSLRSLRAFSAAPPPRRSPTPTARSIVPAGRMIDEEDMPAINAAGIQEVKIRSVLTCEAHERRLRRLLRSRSGARHAGQHGRGGRRHRRPVDRRAGHAADDAHLPHRRRGAACGPVVHRVRTSKAR